MRDMVVETAEENAKRNEIRAMEGQVPVPPQEKRMETEERDGSYRPSGF